MKGDLFLKAEMLLLLKEEKELSNDIIEINKAMYDYIQYKNDLTIAYAVLLNQLMRDKYPIIEHVEAVALKNEYSLRKSNDKIIANLNNDRIGIYIFVLMKHKNVSNIKEAF